MELLNRIKFFFRKPHNVILVVLLLALSYLTLLPLISIIIDTITVHASEVMRIPGKGIGDLTAYHWKKVMFDAGSVNILYKPLLNSLTVSIWSCVVAIVVGGLLAWFVTRTNVRYKKALTSLFIFPYIMPSWTLALAWMNFFKNRVVGGAPGIFTALTGIQTPNWFAYGPFPIIVVTGIHYAPFAFILIGGVLRNMDANLEEAALMLKTSRLKIILKITIPIVLPAILSTFLLTFSSSMSSFAVPSFLGLPVRYQVLTTQMFRTLNGLNPGYGYILALLMIILSSLILGINQRIVGGRRSYTTVTGKSSNISIINLGRVRNVLSLFLLVFVVAISILPLISFAVESLILEPGNYSWSNFTTEFWVGKGVVGRLNSEPGILLNRSVFEGLWNSLKLSIICSFLAGTIGFLSAYAIVRRRGSLLSEVVNNLTFFPYLIPSMAFGAIYLSMFAVRRGPIPALYGTFALLALIGTVKYLPFATRAGIGSMLQLSNEVEEAGIMVGVGWFKRMTRIIIPIQKSSFISGYLLPFSSAMRELSLFILLVTPSTRMLTTLLFQFNEKGWHQYANAINLIIIFVVLICNLAVNKLTGASIDQAIGG